MILSPITALRRNVPSSGALETSAERTPTESMSAAIFSGGYAVDDSRLEWRCASKIGMRPGVGDADGDGVGLGGGGAGGVGVGVGVGGWAAGGGPRVPGSAVVA